MIEFTFNTTRAATNLILGGTIERCPNIKFILSHGGGTLPFLKERIVTSQRLLEQVIGGEIHHLEKDVEQYMKQFYYDIVVITAPSLLNAIKETTDTTHILYGSDAQFASEEIMHDKNKQLDQFGGFTENELINVVRNNALKLFPRFQS